VSVLAREHVTDAIRFWELARVPYNLALAAISLGVLVYAGLDKLGWIAMILPLFILAAMANVLYCVAYPIDLLVQASDFRGLWRHARWALWGLGTLLASVFAYLTLGGPYIFGFPPHGPHG
jgi:hypothetical protein